MMQFAWALRWLEDGAIMIRPKARLRDVEQEQLIGAGDTEIVRVYFEISRRPKRKSRRLGKEGGQ